MTEQEKSIVKALINEGNLQEAIDKLITFKLNESQQQELLAITARYNRLKEKNRAGVLSFEQQSLTENQITASLINLINYPEDKFIPQSKSINKKSTKPAIWKYITAAAVIVGLIAGLADIFNFVNIFSGREASEKLQLTVFVTDTEGNAVLENEGRLNIPLGNRSLNEVIGANGRTNFPDITADNKGDTITIGLDAKGWELAGKKNEFVFTGEPIQLKVTKDNSLGTIKGIVKTRDGQDFISGATILINTDTTTTTNELGIFNVVLPDKMRVKDDSQNYLLTATAQGYTTESQYYSPNSSDAEFRLIKTN